MSRIIYTSMVLFTLLACKQDDNNVAAVVDTALQPYFDAFAEAGAARVVSVNLSGISASIAPIKEGDEIIYGQCQTLSDGSVRVIVNENYWAKASDTEREFLVFHELGHCFLGRSHDNSKVGKYCKSLMYDGSSACTLRYNAETRTAYLDELFSKN